MDFTSQQDKFSKLSDGFAWWVSKYGFTGLMKEYYNSTFSLGFNEEQQHEREEVRSRHLLEISDDGYLSTSSGNRVVVNRSLQRDSYTFIITDSSAYGPFGFYVDIRKKSRTTSNRLLFKHNSRDFKQMTLPVLMDTYEISDEEITKWSTKGEIEWILRSETEGGKPTPTQKQQHRCNLKLISTARFHNIEIEKFSFSRDRLFNQELARFICFCLESLFSEVNDRDHIRNKIVRQRLFYLEPEMSLEKKMMITRRFSDGIESMNDFFYNNVSDRNQVDIWSSSRKLILSREQHVEFSTRTLHHSYKKFICPVETPHDVHAGLHVTLACLSVVSPPPSLSSRSNMETMILSLTLSSSNLHNAPPTSLFYNGYYVGKTSKDMRRILHKAKEIDELSSVYFKEKPRSVRGIYVSNYGGRILRWIVKSDNFKDGMFVCPNMEVREEATHANFFLGFAASLVPLIHHNAGPRGVFMANMMKQTLDPDSNSEVILGNGKRWRKHDDTILLTLTSKALRREKYGISMLVKWASHKGLNIEDGIVINKRLLKQEDGIVYNKFSAEVTSHEYLLPISDNDSLLNSYDVDGVIKEGATVNNKQVLATKLKIENKKFIKKTNLKALVDNPSVVRRVTKQEGSISVLTSYSYKLKMGDKLVSSAAQKGVITHVVEEDERADIIINPCCIPSRMTLAQIWEGIISNYHRDNNIEKSLFFPPFSNAVELFCNMIGKNFDSPLDNLIPKSKEDYWYCLNRYYVLGHRVDEKFRVRGEGNKDNTNPHTAQPQRGRKLEGGLRLGVMERDVLISHNSLKTLNYLFSKHGDEIECYYCSGCLSYCHSKTCYLCKSECKFVRINKSEINFKNFVKVAGVNVTQDLQEEEELDSPYNSDSPIYAPGSPNL